ncbi:MAG: amino acid permease [Candidatus Micrarchaeota archaeon]|nr:amino acid permease [Candidatus Micrarchaeota archaeon]MDE1848012.1 amino acid permease [Candidatus Micrarchaeota archaeon]MDE1864611.1 amino acid permease [Candidatus Micrarchaeota archaeon]
MAKIGLAGATAIGLGAIIGAGIFVLSGTTINLAGSGALIAFIITGIVAVIIALELGELSSEMPKETGASYSFTYNAFGSELGFIGGVLLYLGYVAGVSTIALGFGTYLSSAFGIGSQLYTYAFSVLLVIGLTLINYRGIKSTANTDLVLVLFKIIVLLIFVAFAVLYGKWATTQIFGFFSNGTGGIFSASVIALFAYAGFQSIASLTPDLKGGGRTAAKAIIISVIVSMILYVAVTISLLALVPGNKFGLVANPLSYALSSVSAPSWIFILITIGALVATTSATLSMMVGGSRTLYQMSVDGLLPKRFLKTNWAKAPINSILLTAALGILFLFSGNIYIIAAISNFGILFSFLLTGLALIKMRRIRNHYKEKKGLLGSHTMVSFKDVFQMPLYPYLPIIGIVAILVFFYAFPNAVISTGVALTFATIIVYYVIREIKNRPVVKIRFFD